MSAGVCIVFDDDNIVPLEVCIVCTLAVTV